MRVRIISFRLFRARVVSVAQLAEHQTVALGVAGSIPVTHPIPEMDVRHNPTRAGRGGSRAPVAQGIEHRPPEPGAEVRFLPGAPFSGDLSQHGPLAQPGRAADS